MTVQTPICDMFGIRYPIFLAGMGGVSYAEVCAAVSEAGGFGTLGMAGRSTSEIRAEMRKVRQLTKKPFGVDLLAADIIIEEGAAAFISGLGVPPRHLVDRFHAAGLKVRPLPTPPPHDPRPLLHRRSPKANSFQTDRLQETCINQQCRGEK